MKKDRERTFIAISTDIAVETKVRAAQTGDTIKNLVEQALTEYLRKSRGDSTNQDRRQHEPGQEKK